MLKLDPTDSLALNNKGVMFVEQMKYWDAKKCFDKILELDPYDVAALNNKGVLISESNNEMSQKYINKALKLDPEFRNAKEENKLILSTKKVRGNYVVLNDDKFLK